MESISNDQLIKLYFASLKEFSEFESRPRDFGTGDLLYASEIHTIQAIGKNKECNLTELADKMSISKSGISKFLDKLLKKNLIKKEKGKENKKEVFFTLTEKGYIAFKAHEEFDAQMFATIIEQLDSYSAKERTFLHRFLGKLVADIGELNEKLV